MFDEKNTGFNPDENNNTNLNEKNTDNLTSNEGTSVPSLSSNADISDSQPDKHVIQEPASNKNIAEDACHAPSIGGETVSFSTIEENLSNTVHEVHKQPAPITEERPVVNTLPSQSLPSRPSNSEYYGGMAYTKNVDGENKSGYEWDNTSSKNSKPQKKNNTSNGKGFRIFIGTVLTIFTVSVVTLTAMVASQIIGSRTSLNNEPASDKPSFSAQTGVSLQEVPKADNTSTQNYAVYDSVEADGETLTIPQIAAKCSPSSVGIVSQVEVSYSYPFGFGIARGVTEASGSGFIYSSDGYIITNHHVIENANEVTVILHDGTEHKAEVIGSDSLSDIAVLKITPDEGTTLTPMEIGNSDELVVGESVVAIGCPAGIEFIGTVTDGIISAINRNIELTDSYGTTQKTMTLIQTNATINQGNSGGPLINSKGQVIGINTLKLKSSSYEGVGFSIPMNGAMPIIKQLIEHGKVVERTQDDFAYGKGVIGITGSAISEDEAEYYNIPLGVLVVQIDKNSSAAKAGLRRGDIITHYNGKSVQSVNELNEIKGSSRAGEEATVTIYRDNENGVGEGITTDITFTLDPQQ